MDAKAIGIIQSIYDRQAQVNATLLEIEGKLDASHFYGVPVAIFAAFGASILTALATLGGMIIQHRLQTSRDESMARIERASKEAGETQEYYEKHYIVDGIESVQQLLQEWRLCIDRATLALTTKTKIPDDAFQAFHVPDSSFRLSTLTNSNAVYVYLWYLHARISVLYDEAVSERQYKNLEEIEVLIRDALAKFRQVQAAMHSVSLETKSDIYTIYDNELGSEIRSILETEINSMKNSVGTSIQEGDYNPNLNPARPTGDSTM